MTKERSFRWMTTLILLPVTIVLVVWTCSIFSNNELLLPYWRGEYRIYSGSAALGLDNEPARRAAERRELERRKRLWHMSEVFRQHDLLQERLNNARLNADYALMDADGEFGTLLGRVERSVSNDLFCAAQDYLWKLDGELSYAHAIYLEELRKPSPSSPPLDRWSVSYLTLLAASSAPLVVRLGIRARDH